MADCIIDMNIESQKTQISSLLTKPLKKGDIWYLLDSKWFNQWKKFVGYDSLETSFVAHPGPVDNSRLLKEDLNELKWELVIERDYKLVPKDAWGLFLSWYGNCYGQEPIARKVIEQGMFMKHCKVEVYLMDLKLGCRTSLGNIVIQQFSRLDTIQFVEQQMRALFDIPSNTQVRLWNKYMSNTFEPLCNPEYTLQDAGLYSGQLITIEVKNQDGTWSDPINKPVKPVNHSQAQTASKAPVKAVDPSEEIITCIICFNIMTNPKMLLCQHTFCDMCIKQLPDALKKQKLGVKCPTCRQFCPRKAIKSSLVAKKMIEFHFQKTKPSDEKYPYCKLHPSYKIEARCIPCNTEICAKCKFDDHDVHLSESFDAAIKNILPQVTDKMSSISKHIEAIESSISTLQVKKTSLEKDANTMKSQVQDQYDKLMADIDRSKNAVEKEINSKIELLKSAVYHHKQFISTRQKAIGESENAGLLQVLQDTEIECDKMTRNIGKKTTFNLVQVSLEECECESKCLTGKVRKRRVAVEYTKVGD